MLKVGGEQLCCLGTAGEEASLATFETESEGCIQSQTIANSSGCFVSSVTLCSLCKSSSLELVLGGVV